MVGKKRFRAGEVARRHFDPDVAILDDGYQHLSLGRDLNILLVDSSRPLGGERLFPAGRLREPRGALKRADLVVLTRVDQSGDVRRVREEIERIHPGVPVLEACHQPLYLENLASKEREQLSWLSGRKLFLLASLARPAVFRRSLEDLGSEVVDAWSYPDHHWYGEEDWTGIQEAARKAGAEAVVTTEKDAVSLREGGFLSGDGKKSQRSSPGAPALYFLKVEFQITRGEEILDVALKKALG